MDRSAVNIFKKKGKKREGGGRTPVRNVTTLK